MFEQTFVNRTARRPWTLAVSFFLQCALVGLLVLIPLIYTEALPRYVVSTLIGPPVGTAPQPAPPPETRAPQAPRRTASEMVANALLAPAMIPEKAAMIVDEAPLDVPAPPGFHTVIGGVPLGTGGDPRMVGIVGVPGGTGTAPPPPPPAEAPEARPKRVFVGGQVQQAKAISQPMPPYPPLARSARISGVVRLAAVISEAGAIEEVRVISGHPLLVPAAVQGVAQWRYRPTILNGVPVKVDTTIDVHFNLGQ
jgi:periplasmic protein TonB